MAYALTEEPIVLDLCQKRGFFAYCRVPYARRMPASTFAIAGCEASKPCPAIRCTALIAATRRLRVATFRLSARSERYAPTVVAFAGSATSPARRHHSAKSDQSDR